MFSRTLRLILFAAAAIGIPFVWFNPELRKTVQEQWSELSSNSFTAAAEDHDFEVTAEVEALDQIFRFDVSPRWVAQRWPRVSTIRTGGALEGLRAPLVSGTELQDIAGSLTYYFDNHQQLRRITFHGHTGDEQRLVGLVSRQFNLRPEPALGAGLYVARWNGKPTSVLRVSHASVIRAQRPHERLQIVLELNQPSVGYGLSAAGLELLNVDRLTSR
jgi:hypothetical protein